MKIINTLDAHIKFGINLFHKRGKQVIRLYEKKCEFRNPKNESLCFKWGISTIFGPLSNVKCNENYIIKHNILATLTISTIITSMINCCMCMVKKSHHHYLMKN
jgi:hypothetical protein